MERHPLFPFSWGKDEDDVEVPEGQMFNIFDSGSILTTVSLIGGTILFLAVLNEWKRSQGGSTVRDRLYDELSSYLPHERKDSREPPRREPGSPLEPFGPPTPSVTAMPELSSSEAVSGEAGKYIIGRENTDVPTNVYELSKRYWALCRYPRDYTSESTEPGATAWATPVKINDDWSVEGDPSELEGILLLENMALDHLHKSGRPDIGYTDTGGTKHTWYTPEKGFLDAKYVDEVLGFLTLYPIRHQLSGAGESHLCGMNSHRIYESDIRMIRDTGKLLRLLPPSCQLNHVSGFSDKGGSYRDENFCILPQKGCQPRRIHMAQGFKPWSFSSDISLMLTSGILNQVEDGKTYQYANSKIKLLELAPGTIPVASSAMGPIPASRDTKYLIEATNKIREQPEQCEVDALYLTLGIHPLVAMTDKALTKTLLEYAKTVVFVEPEARAAWAYNLSITENYINKGRVEERLSRLLQAPPPTPPSSTQSLAFHSRSVGAPSLWWPLKCKDDITKDYQRELKVQPAEAVLDPPKLAKVLI